LRILGLFSLLLLCYFNLLQSETFEKRPLLPKSSAYVTATAGKLRKAQTETFEKCSILTLDKIERFSKLSFV